ncbi:MAG: lipoprotein-releasing ABC transporter permease subunit [Hyphomicrobium sp.]|uniref:lipoprotein-releasing ABC transporter permease subunit n=1 Tax=Hyphomicrobium sp. TaxID=82 RepID=UPI001323D131|nr:lipoprotein-releasing ABC transporter permease subunit [Hyphomicrobium sp.]KAB2941096.1 MAG: lipoprotein-releasing ABC transporter permease subunit [Hyphomicrobium sp.]MBZ0210991.1 lipoprotein-releasing ABC transporter permease subunit [Hyphomicrobium sp.]MCZ7595983.1 lipoprotein-releasing ABC transporter permease subunit [Hyphomicrobium sp.]
MTSAASAALGRAAAREGVRDTLPFSAYEWMLALRYLRARRKEGFISVIAGFSFTGIMLGVATLIIVMAVMNGFRNELFAKILGLNGHVIVNKIGGRFEDYDEVAKRIARVPGIKAAMPLIEGQVMVSSAVQATGALVRGMTEDGMRALPLIADNIRFGSLNGFGQGSGIAIGTRLANMLRVNVGDTITLVSPRGASTPFGTAPRTKPYVVTALFEMGMAEYDRTMVFMPLLEAQRYFSRGPEVDAIEVVVDNPGAIDNFVREMKRAVGPTNHVSDWRARNETFFTVLEVERNVMFIILSLIVLVAALNIISGLMMLVKDKGRDVAILRTMGATRGAMMRVFLITGASIGVVGTFAGLILGIVFCLNIESIRELVSWMTSTTLFDPNVYYLTRLPADMEPRETAAIVGMALALSVLATLYPSWRASTLDPVEALRYE